MTAREPAGYYFSQFGAALASLVGHDVSRFTLSYARGAGGIIGTTHDMTVWERVLYGSALLPSRQQAELTSLVSEKTGQPIAQTSREDELGFSLGVEQGTGPDLGTIWRYEGGTLGFRTFHIYLPNSGVVLAMGLNSQSSNDSIGILAVRAYETLIAHGAISGLPAPHRADRP